MSPTRLDYFRVLGVSSEASLEEIKRAFKQLALQYHPDRNPNNPWAEEKFKEIVVAYSYLSGNLEAYRALNQETASQEKININFKDLDDIFQDIFEVPAQPIFRKDDLLLATLPLTLEEAYRGGSHTLKLPRAQPCSECHGRGVEAGAKTFTCTYCFGSGALVGLDGEEVGKECPRCNGRGFLSALACLRCRGRGFVEKMSRVKVTVPPRSNARTILSLSGEGNEFTVGTRGDLQVRVELKPHERFVVDGKDLIYEVILGMKRASLGGEVSVPTLEGNRKVPVTPGFRSGQVVRLKGLGLGGDLLLRFWIKTSVAVTEKQQKLLEAAEASETSTGLWQKFKKWIW